MGIMKSLIKKIKKIVVPVFIVFALFCTLSFFFLYYSPRVPLNHNFNKNNNAAWVRHQWFSHLKTNEEVDILAKQLKSMEISKIFIHIGPLNAKGKIPPYNVNIWLKNRDKIKHRIPKVKILAWLGGVTQVKYGVAHDTIDMKNHKLLNKIATLSEKTIKTCRFDGIHYDIEPLPGGDKGFLYLLKQTKNLIKNKELSVAVPSNFSSDKVTGVIRGIQKKKIALWGPSYYREVAKCCDEIAVMSYDSLMITPASYRKFIVRQIKIISKALEGTNCNLLVGVPTYNEKTISHRPSVENVKHALEGVILGLQSSPNKKIVQGVAIYALWTTESYEIDHYKKIWLEK